MTTPLIDIVTRRTTLLVELDGVKREVEVSLIPGDEQSATPPAIGFHLVGLHERNDRTVPIRQLLQLAGYKVKIWPKQPDPQDPAAAIAALFDKQGER